jgi:hypothetical protein
MRRAGLIFLFAFVFAISSAQLSSNERAALTIAAAGKADLQHAATIPVAFEELWGGVAYDKASPADERMAHLSVRESESDWSLEARAVVSPDGRTPSSTRAQRPENASTRIYVLYGQYGVTTSAGMYLLAQSLARYGEVSVHEWNDRTIVPDARRHSGKIVIIGYSLGANSTVAIANKLPHVDLIVAYDPSRLSPLAHEANGEFTQEVKASVRRAICFYNPYAWYFGGARLEGPQVETVPISHYHLAVAMDQSLHEITEQAVRQVAEGAPAKQAPEPVKPVAAAPGEKTAPAATSLSRTAAGSTAPKG